MIDLRSDTLTRPTDAMRAAMARAEVGDDVYGEDPTVRALEERVAGLFGHEAALFTPTGSMANVLAVGSLVAPGQEVLCEASAHIARAELGAHGAITGLTMRTWTHPRGQVDLAAIAAMYAPGHGAVLRAHRGGLGREHPQLRRRRGAAARRPAGAARVGRPASAPASTSTAPGSGTPTSRPASRSREYGAVADVLVGVPVQGARRPGRLADGRLAPTRSPRRASGASGWAAGCARSASWRPPGCTPSTTTSSGWPTTTPTPGCWRRRAGSTRPTVDTNIVVVERTTPRRSSRPRREAGVRVSAVGPTAVRMVTHLDVSQADAEAAAQVLPKIA